MFRQSLRRCATQARSAATASLLSQCRSALPITRSRILPALSASLVPLTRIAGIPRAYSTEASAEASEATSAETESAQEPAKNAVQEDATRFADLEARGIHPNFLRAIIDDLGYDTMTPVQAKTINPALKGTDIVAQAKTGTGKTIAFLLPLLQRMVEEDPSLAGKQARRAARADDIRGIVLSPTRELAEQIAAEARRLVQHTGLVVQCAVGGTDRRQMMSQTRRQGCHLLVATPGRLNDLLQDSSSGIDAPNLAALVLDEADRMLDVGFERELNEIVKCLPSPEEKVRQTMLVSATIPDDVIRLARTMVRPEDFEFVQTIPENESLTHDKVPQHIVPVSSWNNVFPALFELMEREAQIARDNPDLLPFKAIVYFNTTSLVELAGEIAFQRRRNNTNGHPMSSYIIQSKLSQQQRQKAADMFRQAKSGVLLSSDVTARGMDFPNVTHVIQVDTPRDRESYIHRLGRTGRQDKEGQGWLLIPHISINAARKQLRGLPIKQNASLEAAEADVDSQTQMHDELKTMYTTLPRRLLGATYTSMFGMAADRDSIAQDVHHWIQHGWGWEKPPAVSPRWASNLGLSRTPGMNITHERDNYDDDANDRPRFGGGSRDGGSRGYGARDSNSSDPFNSMW
ncbi:hypothetical protein G7046_g7199 [Stylonectria norvegica]|nr:hypothetical protein G7046_g7199 [Stylonectria norvegica]